MRPTAHVTLREPSYFVLAALLDGRMHGYAVVKRVEELSAGRVKLAAGSLYSVIDRLLGEGLITADGEEIVNGRARRYYRLTEDGQRVLGQEADRLAQAARVVHERLSQDNSPRPDTGRRPTWRTSPA